MRKDTLKGCRAFNAEQHQQVQTFVKKTLNIDAEIKAIDIPDNTSPWETLSSVLEMYYAAQKERYFEMFYRQSETKSCDIYKKTLKAEEKISDGLRQKVRQLEESTTEDEKSPRTDEKAIKTLLDWDNANGWICNLENVTDELVGMLAGAEVDATATANALHIIRMLVKFFKTLQEQESNK